MHARHAPPCPLALAPFASAVARAVGPPLVVLSTLAALSCDGPPPKSPGGVGPDPSASASAAEYDPYKEEPLKIEDLVVGAGASAKKGSAVSVHYVGTLTTGKQFDSSIERGKPFTFIIGESAVIEGWHRGVVGMRVGGKRRLTVPPSLGYGDNGQGDIPPRATLIFEIELLHVVE